MTSSLPPQSQVSWERTYRIIPSRYPPIALFERIADPEDWEILAEIEGLTNDRLRAEAGDLSRVPRHRCISGPWSSPIMAAFTHRPERPGRFDSVHFGAYYAAQAIETAIEETSYHQARFRRRTREPASSFTMRTYIGRIDALLYDIRGGWPRAHDPDSYSASQSLARDLHDQGGDGIVYDSVRHAGGSCFAAFYPDVLSRYGDEGWAIQGPHFRYHFDGNRVSSYEQIGDGAVKAL
ncbi:MAG: RES family NAD+ phosphorylase [Nannocystaceae bacterium]